MSLSFRQKIDWSSNESYLLLSPTHTSKLKLNELPKLKAHIWLATSGTSAVDNQEGPHKLVALSKEALLCSAKSVNGWIGSDKSDIWLSALPQFHVGGLSIEARAYMSSAKVVYTESVKWNTDVFIKECQDNKITLCSLVPTQVFDLVGKGLSAPEKLRAVFVGGGALSESLYRKARSLGWPLLPTYGMTECSSQVATAGIESLNQSSYPELKLLPHIETEIKDGRLKIKSESLLTSVCKRSEVGEWVEESPLEQGWFKTNDLVGLDSSSRSIKVLGRKDDAVKINGELVNLKLLQSKFDEICESDKSVVLAWPEPRKENEVVLVTEDLEKITVEESVIRFNSQVLGFEKISRIYYLAELPRTELGKVKAKGLRTWLEGL